MNSNRIIRIVVVSLMTVSIAAFISDNKKYLTTKEELKTVEKKIQLQFQNNLPTYDVVPSYMIFSSKESKDKTFIEYNLYKKIKLVYVGEKKVEINGKYYFFNI